MSGVVPCLVVHVGGVAIGVTVSGASGAECRAAEAALRHASEDVAALLGDLVVAAQDGAELPPPTGPSAKAPAAPSAKAPTAPSADGCDTAAPSAKTPGPVEPLTVVSVPRAQVGPERMAAARQYGKEVKRAQSAGKPLPPAPSIVAPLRARVWVAIGGQPELAGIYGRWLGGAATAKNADPPCHVVGFPSLAEVEEFLAGMETKVPDRRR